MTIFHYDSSVVECCVCFVQCHQPPGTWKHAQVTRGAGPPEGGGGGAPRPPYQALPPEEAQEVQPVYPQPSLTNPFPAMPLAEHAPPVCPSRIEALVPLCAVS